MASSTISRGCWTYCVHCALMQQLIAHVCPSADSEAAASLFEEKSPHVVKKQKLNARRFKDDMPPWVVITLPSFRAHNDSEIDSVKAKIIPALDKPPVLEIELDPRVLAYIKIRAEGECYPQDTPQKKDKLQKGLFWVAERKAFRATRTDDQNKKVSQQFKPDDPDNEESFAEAKNEALEWMSKGD